MFPAIAKTAIFVVFFSLFFSPISASASTWYVNCDTGVNTTESGYGTSEALPWKNITYASTQAGAGDIIYVAAGIYNAATGESFPINIAAGGYVRSTASPAASATIDAGSNARVLTLNFNSTLEGFTVRSSGAAGGNGLVYFADDAKMINNFIYASGSSANALYVASAADNSLIENNNISAVAGSSTGIYLGDSADNETIRSNTIEAGASGTGINLSANNSNYNITGNVIRGQGSGYGINSSIIYSGNISTNEVTNFGEGVRIHARNGTTINIYSNTILKNTVGIRAAYGNYTPKTLNAKNNIICGSADLGSFMNGMNGMINDEGTFNSSYNDIWNVNHPYSASISGKTGDIARYPRFVSVEADDYRIWGDSPCAAAGEFVTYMGCYPPVGGSSNITSESWVMPGPDDGGGDGSYGNPWKTIKKGLYRTEYIVHANAGTYNAANGESLPAAPVTLAQNQYLRSEALPTVTATIDGGSAAQHVVLQGINTTLEGFTVKTTNANTSYYGVLAYENAAVLNNSIFISARGVGLDGAGAKVKANTVKTDSSAYDILLTGNGDSCVIENNAIDAKAGTSTGIYLGDSADNETIRNNTIEAGTGGTGISISANNSNYNITGNVIRGQGSGYGINSNVIYSGNISTNEVTNFGEGVRIHARNGTTTNVYSNTILKNTVGIRAAYGNYTPKTLNAKNNIICGTVVLGSFTAGTYGIVNDEGTFNSTYNDIWNLNFRYYNLAISGKTGDIARYPRFVSPEVNDYRIYNDSPCASGGEGGTYMGRYSPLGTASNITSESWVMPGPDDGSGDGSYGNPWKTIKKGLYRTEYIVHANAGMYNAANGESLPAAPVTLAQNQYLRSEALPTTAATIDGGGAAQHVILQGVYTTLEGFTVKTTNPNTSYYGVLAYENADVLNNSMFISVRGVVLDGAGGEVKGNTIKNDSSAYDILLTGNGDSWVLENNAIDAKAGASTGIYMADSADNETIKNNTIEAGTGGTGISISANNSNYNITGNVIRGQGSGYGINSNVIYSGNISTNEVTNFGEGVRIHARNGTTTNVYSNTILKNTVGIRAAYGNYTPKTLNVGNCIVANNPTSESGAGTGVQNDEGTVNVFYSDIFGVANPYGGTITKTATIHAIAQFTDPSDNDYHLRMDSPCIDTGDPAWTDPDGTRSDMGRYPYFQTDFTGPTIGVTAPTSGESLIGLSSYNITWTMTDESGIRANSLSLYYSTNEGTSYTVIATGEPNDGGYLWPVPWIATNKAKIKITAWDGAPFNQTGNLGTGESGVFTILTDITPPSVEVVSPNGGEKWKGGSVNNITFTASDENGVAPNSANLYYTSGESWVPIATGQATAAAYSWPLPMISTTEARVRVTVLDNNNTLGTGESAAKFTIDSIAPTVNVIVPNAGTTWEGNRSQNITWSASDNFNLKVNPITIYYSINNGSTYDLLASDEANTGSYGWNIPAIDTTEAKVKISAADECGNITTQESGKFVIDSTPPTVPNLSYPPNGVTINTASPNMTWEASTDSVSGIASYEITIDTTVMTQGATTSYVPAAPLTETTHTWKVRAKNGAGMWGNYSSTWSFTINFTSPEVAGITLKDRITGNTQYTNKLAISIEANGVTGSPIDMRLAQDAGFSQNDTGWVTYQNPTEYTLTAGEGTREVYYKVRNAGSNESATISNTIIIDTISPEISYIVLKDRTDGSTMESNELTISIEAFGVSQDAVVMNIAQDPGFSQNATGWISYQQNSQYTFSGGNGTREAYLKVRDAAQNESNVVTNNIMVRASRPTVVVLAPNGGERLTGLGQTYTIRYTASDTYGLSANPITIRLSTNSGESWTQIASGQTNNGTYSWTVPALDSTLCRISIEAENTVGVMGSDMSDSDFIVDSTRPTVVSITPSNGATSVAISAEVTIEFSEEMSRESVEQAFSLAGTGGSFSWDGSGRIVTFRPSSNLTYYTDYNVAVSAAAADLAGNGLASAFGSRFTTIRSKDSEAPKVVLKIVGSDGREIAMKNGDYISALPKFRGAVTDNLEVDKGTIKFYLNGVEVTPSITENGPADITVDYTPAASLVDETVRTHTIRLEAQDRSGNLGFKEIKDLKVSTGQVKIVGLVLVYPQVFSSRTGAATKIIYNLTADSDVMIYMFSSSGQNVWTNHSTSGTEGGRAGYNEVGFNGISDLDRRPLGNGIYVFKITANKKVIGTGHVVIND